jgi:alkanesulfonate monooxygenase SsuD/methylene tetrahydromethanopterin reductase-like flavin-dependent oxidoreductase (luciferase family)
MSRLQFGLSLNMSAAPGNDPVALACRAEALGFDFVGAADHPCGDRPSFETPTMLTWIAARTSRITIATRVLGVPYRPPPMVAKMAETLSRLSGGRLILGLGGGYSDAEFRAFGLGVPTPGQKVQGLAEAITIIRGLWSEPSFTFAGRRYQTRDAQIEPKPARPIPIWLGTFGDRALAVTGQLADGWIPSHGFAPPEQASVLRDKVLAAAARAGRPDEAITCAYHIEVRVGRPDEAPPGIVSGPAGAVAGQLISFVRRGFTALSLSPAGPDPDEQAERLAREVLPEVRAAF